MQPRPKFWISSIIAILVVSFLVGFAPIRLAHERGFDVDSYFGFTVKEPLYEDEEDSDEVVDDIRDILAAAGLSKDDLEVEVPTETLFTVDTNAVSEEQAQSDRKLLLETLGEHYDGLTETTPPREQEQQEEEAKPVATLGPFGLYTPLPQLRLGLDLQGGAHVVLQCLSSAKMSFVATDTPLVAPEGAEAADDEYQPPFTSKELIREIQGVLAATGIAPEELSEVDIQIIGGSRLVVETRPDNEAQAKRQQQAIEDFLAANYPGVQIEAVDMSAVFVDEDTADKVKYIIEQRLYRLGEIREPVIQKQGYDRIIVEMPGVKDPQRVLDILKSTALLEFRLIPERYEPLDNITYQEWNDTTANKTVTWDQVRAESTAEFTGRDLLPNATVQSGQTGDWIVAFELRPDKKDDFHQFTRRNIGRYMAIVLDGECKMSPVIRSAIPGNGIIEGNMTAQEASDLKLLLNAGALPVPLQIVENRTVSATLGQDSILRSLRAAAIGVAAVMVFMIAYYRLPGVLADLALMLYIVLVIAVTAYSEVTLTLPGIAGIILSLGTAVDANVIIFERLKEELWSRRSMRAAVAAGFDRAWTAILDANVTTLIAAAVLYWLGTTLIKGFAIMLFIGVVCHLFTAVTVTRWLLTMVGEASWAQNRALYGVGERSDEEEQTQPA